MGRTPLEAEEEEDERDGGRRGAGSMAIIAS
jgi:hypothetical protein